MKFVKQFFLTLFFAAITFAFPEGLSADTGNSYNEALTAQLKSKGYPGLRITKNQVTDDEKGYENALNEKLNTLLLEENYNELTLFINAEEDLDYRIEWLRPHAEKGHVILMFELSKAICLRADQRKTSSDGEKAEATKWFILGSHCADLDEACSSTHHWLHQNYVGVSKEISDAYFGTLKLLIKERDMDTYITPKNVLEIVRGWTPKESNPSPAWTTSIGERTLYPKETWLEKRKERHRTMINTYEMFESQLLYIKTLKRP